MKLLFVAGTFDDKGKMSGYAEKFHAHMKYYIKIPRNYTFINGGYASELTDIVKEVKDFDVVIWTANVPNNYPKYVEEIKKVNPKCLLITSKRNDGDKYSFMHLLAKALKIKSNLVIEFKKDDAGIIAATLFDPLGNIFCEDCTDMGVLTKTLFKRIEELLSFTRVQSVCGGPIVEDLVLPDDDVELNKFCQLIQGYAAKYHEFVHSNDTSRLLGNVSFRCESGFPSFRDKIRKNIIYVSKRNIDKREIKPDGFVPVMLTDDSVVHYFGDNKPSVDTPIQIKLYNYYKNVNFILHSHVYVEKGLNTKTIIPCGAVEEFDEIQEALSPYAAIANVKINLKGHGSIVLAYWLPGLENISYIKRAVPERHEVE